MASICSGVLAGLLSRKSALCDGSRRIITVRFLILDRVNPLLGAHVNLIFWDMLRHDASMLGALQNVRLCRLLQGGVGEAEVGGGQRGAGWGAVGAEAL